MPAISVIMASYNYAHYLPQAIDSVLAQTLGDWELVVVDDGSKDNSMQVLRNYAEADNRIRVLQHADKGNHGLAATLQLGLESARSDVVAFLESDDFFEPYSLEVRLTRLLQSGAALCFCLPQLFVEGGIGNNVKKLERHLYNIDLLLQRKPAAFSLFHEFCIMNVVPTFSCVMTYKSSLNTLNYNSPQPAWLDYWLWLQLSVNSTFTFSRERLTSWRIHEGSYNHDKMKAHDRNENRRFCAAVAIHHPDKSHLCGVLGCLLKISPSLHALIVRSLVRLSIEWTKRFHV